MSTAIAIFLLLVILKGTLDMLRRQAVDEARQLRKDRQQQRKSANKNRGNDDNAE
jgi:hypothetical protein